MNDSDIALHNNAFSQKSLGTKPNIFLSKMTYSHLKWIAYCLPNDLYVLPLCARKMMYKSKMITLVVCRFRTKIKIQKLWMAEKRNFHQFSTIKRNFWRK